MIIFYNIWLFVYKITLKNALYIQKWYFLDPVYLHRYNNLYYLPFFKKMFLVLFYNEKAYEKIFYFVDNIQSIEALRLHKYTTSHNFFSKFFLETVTFSDSKKRKKSILKIKTVQFLNRNDFKIIHFVNIILFEKIRYSLTWRNLPYIDHLDMYLSSKITYELLNPKTFNGFFLFLGKYSSFFFEKRSTIYTYYNTVKKDHKIHTDYYVLDSKMYKFIDSIPKYTKFYENLNRPKSKDNTYFGDVFLKTLLFKKFELNEAFDSFYKRLYSIKYKPTDISQHLEDTKVTSFFIRKNKIFNKGRYSRNRQLYRTGVYWCLWLNIINVFGLYYYFYRFVFNFGYFYLPMLILILSIFGSRIVKYRFYNLTNVVNEIILFIELFSKFMSEIIKNFLLKTKDLIVKLAVYVYYVVIDFFTQK